MILKKINTTSSVSARVADMKNNYTFVWWQYDMTVFEFLGHIKRNVKSLL